MATYHEISRELHAKTSPEIADFRRRLGHGPDDWGACEYADYLRKNPDLEKVYCVLLDLPTEEQRAIQATISARRRDWLQIIVGVLGLLASLAK